MFNRRDSESQSSGHDRPPASSANSSRKNGAAFIGPSIQIKGDVIGQEDLLVEGEIRGKVELKANKVTIGQSGRVFADVHAKMACVEGQMDGHLVVQEQLEILPTARIKGTITAPRISLKDGARFNGTIDMDPQAKVLAEVFGGHTSTSPTMPRSAKRSGNDSKQPD